MVLFAVDRGPRDSLSDAAGPCAVQFQIGDASFPPRVGQHLTPLLEARWRPARSSNVAFRAEGEGEVTFEKKVSGKAKNVEPDSKLKLQEKERDGYNLMLRRCREIGVSTVN